MEYCHFSWDEALDLPIEYRKWFIQRKQQENERIKEAAKKNKPEGRASPKPRKPPPRR